MSAKNIAYNTVVQIVGKFLGFFISAFSIVILSEHLGTVGMGYYTTVTAFVGFFLILAELGFNTVMVREIAQNWSERVSLTGEFFGLRILFSVIVLGLSVPIALLIPQYNGLVAVGVGIVAMTQFFLLTNQIFVNILQLNLRMDKAVIGETINRLITLGLYIVAGRYTQNLESFFYAVLWITSFAAVVNLVVSYVFAVRCWPIRPVISFSRWRELMVLIWPMTVFSFLGVIHFKADTILLSLMRTPYEVGIYGYAYKIIEIMFTIPLMFLGVVFPRLSSLVVIDEPGFRDLAQKTFEVLLLGTIPFIAGIYVLAPYLTVLLSRQSLDDGLLAGQALQILSIALFAWFFGALYQHMLLATKHYSGLIRNVALVAGVNIVLNVVFIPVFGYRAAAVITVITEGSMLVLSMLYAHHTLGFKAKLKGWLPVLCATTLMGFVVIWSQNLLPSLVDFSEASRLSQLGQLSLFATIGAGTYVVVLMLWGKGSPLRKSIELLKLNKNA